MSDQHGADGLGIGVLIVHEIAQRGEFLADAFFEPGAPKAGRLFGHVRRVAARSSPRAPAADGLGERHLFPLGDPVEALATAAILQCGREILATPAIWLAPIASQRACSKASNAARAVSPAGMRSAWIARHCDGAA